MRTRIMKLSVLFALGFASPAWASPRELPSPPVDEKDAVRLVEPPPKPLASPVSSRGQLLYENHCTVCHASVVHLRSDRRAQSLPEIRTWVMHWSRYLQLHWSKEEVDEVVDYLNRRFYKFESR